MHTLHLLPGVAVQPNLELKTQPKQLLRSLPLDIVLPGLSYFNFIEHYLLKQVYFLYNTEILNL